jgi:(p)ppGpp synthase/HD superfamily hydrolase
MDKLAKAIEIAAHYHLNQTDKSGKPYILHCLRVMDKVKSKESEVKQIAVLHDLLEDTDCFPGELRRAGFSSRVTNALTLLTHTNDETYEDYINSVCTCRDAMLVKLADLRHNSDITRLKGVTEKDLKRMAKYHKAYTQIKKTLKEL